MFTKILHNKEDLFIFFSQLFVGTLQLALVEHPVDINSISVVDYIKEQSTPAS